MHCSWAELLPAQGPACPHPSVRWRHEKTTCGPQTAGPLAAGGVFAGGVYWFCRALEQPFPAAQRSRSARSSPRPILSSLIQPQSTAVEVPEGFPCPFALFSIGKVEKRHMVLQFCTLQMAQRFPIVWALAAAGGGCRAMGNECRSLWALVGQIFLPCKSLVLF